MKVILLRDVAKIGRRYEIKEVSGGHALNMLIPRKLAIPATSENLRKLEKEMAQRKAVHTASESELRALAEALKGAPVTITASANEQGHLFKGIHAEDIGKELRAQGHEIATEYLVLDHPVKAVGAHEARVVIGKEHIAFPFHVVSGNK